MNFAASAQVPWIGERTGNPDGVVECVQDAAQAGTGLRYRSACDPRLNPAQADEVVARFAALL